jgi:hypothetical protein
MAVLPPRRHGDFAALGSELDSVGQQVVAGGEVVFQVVLLLGVDLPEVRVE